jgi:hypothetical protein
MRTSRWAMESSFDAAIEREQKQKEEKEMREAQEYLNELHSEELLDSGMASYAGEY